MEAAAQKALRRSFAALLPCRWRRAGNACCQALPGGSFALSWLARLSVEASMAGLDETTKIPTEIKLHQKSRILELVFPDDERFELSYEFLRVFTPSAEARGHGPGQEVLQVGKREIGIERIEAVGNYAIRPIFSDGHDSGLYSWDVLYQLGSHKEELWTHYLARLATAGASREPGQTPAPPAKAPAGSCGKR
jgi:DUF971 family protein